MTWILRHRWTLAWIAVLALAGAIRLHNAWVYNPYWGYDGGAHLAYVETVAYHGRLPAPNENYLAWHEPLFYIISAGIFNWARIAGLDNPWLAIQIFQAILGMAFVGLAGLLAWEAYRSRGAALATAATVAVLPPAVFVGSYVTNELLAHLLIVAALILMVRLARSGRGSVGGGLWIGVVISLALLTKLSALILVAALIVICAALATQARSAVPLKTLAAALLIIIPLALPWQIYRQQYLGGALNLNNFEARLAEDGGPPPTSFLFSFDRSIMLFPYWDSGSRGLWSILYAGTFGDYDNIFGNVDGDNLLPSGQKILTASGRYVSVDRLAAGRTLLRFAIVFIPILLLGALAAVRRVAKKEKSGADLVLAVFAGISLAALLYYTVKYPFIERGTVKPIFILSAIAVLFIFGWKALLDLAPKRWMGGALTAGIIGLFTIFAWPIIWITSG